MRRGLRICLAGGLLLALLTIAPVTTALGYFSTSGSGRVTASATTLAAPTISSATPGLSSVLLSWNTVTGPGSGAVSYYVPRDGGVPAGSCPTSSSPAGEVGCSDSGMVGRGPFYNVGTGGRAL